MHDNIARVGDWTDYIQRRFTETAFKRKFVNRYSLKCAMKRFDFLGTTKGEKSTLTLVLSLRERRTIRGLVRVSPQALSKCKFATAFLLALCSGSKLLAAETKW